jgi:hypothetical protein
LGAGWGRNRQHNISFLLPRPLNFNILEHYKYITEYTLQNIGVLLEIPHVRKRVDVGKVIAFMFHFQATSARRKDGSCL